MAGNVTTGPEMHLAGRQLAQRYAMAEEIAPGALCRIGRGEDLVLRRPVVVKAVPPAQVEVYVAALRATASLTHPAAVALYDAIHEDGWLLLVQEAISGQALTRYLRQGVPSERAVNLALQLAQALAYTHHRDIVHGDLTPSAILVDRQAMVRVNNFGMPPDLDHFLAEGGAEVQSLIAEGTPYSDVLALGVLLRQLLSSVELAGTEPGTRQLRPDIPEELAQFVTRCTMPEANGAIRDAAAATLALEEISARLAATRHPASTDTPAMLRAARSTATDRALWASEQTVEHPQVAQMSLGPLERGSHEVGAQVTATSDLGHSDGAMTRPSSEEDLAAVPPLLRLPTRPLPVPLRTAEAGGMLADAPTIGDASGDTRGIMLGSVLLAGALLFVIFFLIGYLGPVALGGR